MQWPLRRLAPAVVVGLLGAVAVGGIVLRARSATQPARRVRPPAPVVAVAPAARPQVPGRDAGRPRAAERPPAPADATDPLPPSLAGTDVDGWLGVDDDGHLVVTPGARWFFDYFLSTTGEESPEQIRTRIVAEIDKRLPAVGAREAVDLLDRYLTYRERVRALASGGSEDLQRRLAQLHDIRRETLGDADAAVLFGEEEQVQAVDIQRRRTLSDATLSPEERERRLGELEQQLPAAVRQARSEAMTLLRLHEEEQQLRDAGASAEDLHAVREERYGAEAADRLAALDRERAGWQQRLDDYRRARQAIESAAGLTPDARARALETLLAGHFTAEERLRVEALDEMRQASD